MRLSKQTKSNIFIITISIFVVAVILIGMVNYSNNIWEELSDSSNDALSESTKQIQNTINIELEKELISLQNVSDSLGKLQTNAEDTQNYLISIQSFHNYDNIVAVHKTGEGITSEGEILDFSDTVYFEYAMLGNSFITDLQVSKIDGEEKYILVTPTRVDGEIIGAIFAEYPKNYLDQYITDIFAGEGSIHITNHNGDIISSSTENISSDKINFYNVLENSVFEDENTHGNIIENINSQEFSGLNNVVLTPQNADEKLVFDCKRLNFNNWNLFLVVPYETLYADATEIIDRINFLTVISLLGGLALVSFVIVLRRNAMINIKTVAYYDKLTSLPNLPYFKRMMKEMLQFKPDLEFACTKIDVVNFKILNEIYNYETGNELIETFGKVLKSVNEPNFLAARIKADEFIVFSEKNFAVTFAENKEVFEQLYLESYKNLREYNLDFRYARYFIKKGETDVNAIIDKVTITHNMAKQTKKSIIADYNDNYKSNLIKNTEITNKMTSALYNNEFVTFLQPKFYIESGKIAGAEALVRWFEADGKMIFPSDFIPVFESNGFIVDLDKKMLKNVCATIRKWLDAGIEPVPVSVNFSRLHLNNPEFITEIKKITDLAGVPRKYIEIELTESTILENETVLISTLEKLHKSGFKLSMDDFGSGYSSLGLLKNLDVDVIKMDRSFLVDGEKSPKGNIVIECVVKMAQELEIETVAEGVETIEQVEFLKSLGCDIAQGYYFAKPMPSTEFTEKIGNNSFEYTSKSNPNITV